MEEAISIQGSMKENLAIITFHAFGIFILFIFGTFLIKYPWSTKSTFMLLAKIK